MEVTTTCQLSKADTLISKDRRVAEMGDKISLSLYGELKLSWGKQVYTSCCSVKEVS